MLPGMGLYCDHCTRLCRAYGEWFSWNCAGCNFDMCNKSLQESRDAWAIVPPLGEEDLSALAAVDLSGNWTISLSGPAVSGAAKDTLGNRSLLSMLVLYYRSFLVRAAADMRVTCVVVPSA